MSQGPSLPCFHLSLRHHPTDVANDARCARALLFATAINGSISRCDVATDNGSSIDNDLLIVVSVPAEEITS